MHVLDCCDRRSCFTRIAAPRRVERAGARSRRARRSRRSVHRRSRRRAVVATQRRARSILHRMRAGHFHRRGIGVHRLSSRRDSRRDVAVARRRRSARGQRPEGRPGAGDIAEQVTVTAGRRELRGADAPGASSLLLPRPTCSAPPRSNPTTRCVRRPGFTLFRRSSSRTANPTTQGVTMRGLSASGASRTLVLAGGVPLNDPFGGWVYWGRVPQAAIERIEVVRGGLSDLYGADAVGGVIHIVPFDCDALVGARRRWKRVSSIRVACRLRSAGRRLAQRRRCGASPSSGCRPKARRSSPRRRAGRSTRPPASRTDGVRVGRHAPGARAVGRARVSSLARIARTARRCRPTTRISGRSSARGRAMRCGARGRRPSIAARRATISRSAPSPPTRERIADVASARAGRHGRRQRRMVPHVFAHGILGGAETRHVEGVTEETRIVNNVPQTPTLAGGGSRRWRASRR